MTVRIGKRLLLMGALGAAMTVLAACGGGKGLIPASQVSALQNDFNNVSSAVQSGDCAAAGSALAQARSDDAGLPASVNAALRQRLQQGLRDLQRLVPQQCHQSSTTSSSSSTPSSTSSDSSSSSSTSSSAPTSRTTVTTTTTQSPSSSSSATAPGGGAQAPGAPPGNGNGNGNGAGGANVP